MAIANRHIPRRWQTFIVEDISNPTTLCKVRTSTKHIGIPGVTDQPIAVGNKGGWCAKCSLMLLRTTASVLYTDIPEPLRLLYSQAADQCLESLKVWESNV